MASPKFTTHRVPFSSRPDLNVPKGGSLYELRQDGTPVLHAVTWPEGREVRTTLDPPMGVRPAVRSLLLDRVRRDHAKHKLVMTQVPGTRGLPSKTFDVKGENIASRGRGGSDLGAKLTNVTYEKFNINDPAIVAQLEAEGYKAPKGRQDAEAWYKLNKTGDDAEDVRRMARFIRAKFNQYPELLDEVRTRGGVRYLEASEHRVFDTPRTRHSGFSWEGRGQKSGFIRALMEGYKAAQRDLVGGTPPPPPAPGITEPSGATKPATPLAKGLQLRKIISGGQEGADRAGLEVAKHFGLETGGHVPAGWRVWRGKDETLQQFGLEQTGSSSWGPRTRLNVENADATVIFTMAQEDIPLEVRTSRDVHDLIIDSRGSQLTVRDAHRSGKPFIVNPSPEELRDFLTRHKVQVLNVAGNRLAKNSTIGTETAQTLYRALNPAARFPEGFEFGVSGTDLHKVTQAGIPYDPKVKHRLSMSFEYGKSGALPAAADNPFPTTMDAIIGGRRTATSRKGHQLDAVQPGDIVEFYDRQGRTIRARVTGKRAAGEVTPEEWAQVEGYDPEATKAEWETGKQYAKRYTQITYEVIPEVPPVEGPTSKLPSSMAARAAAAQVDGEWLASLDPEARAEALRLAEESAAEFAVEAADEGPPRRLPELRDPEVILTAKDVRAMGDNTVFVFGSNTEGRHGKGAALVARELGAQHGVSEGRTGRNYAIPTKDLGKNKGLPLHQIEESIERFVDYARAHPELRFVLTKVGTGLAGHKETEILRAFAQALNNTAEKHGQELVPRNIQWPERWHPSLHTDLFERAPLSRPTEPGSKPATRTPPREIPPEEMTPEQRRIHEIKQRRARGMTQRVAKLKKARKERRLARAAGQPVGFLTELDELLAQRETHWLPRLSKEDVVDELLKIAARSPKGLPEDPKFVGRGEMDITVLRRARGQGPSSGFQAQKLHRAAQKQRAALFSAMRRHRFTDPNVFQAFHRRANPPEQAFLAKVHEEFKRLAARWAQEKNLPIESILGRGNRARHGMFLWMRALDNVVAAASPDDWSPLGLEPYREQFTQLRLSGGNPDQFVHTPSGFVRPKDYRFGTIRSGMVPGELVWDPSDAGRGARHRRASRGTEDYLRHKSVGGDVPLPSSQISEIIKASQQRRANVIARMGRLGIPAIGATILVPPLVGAISERAHTRG